MKQFFIVLKKRGRTILSPSTCDAKVWKVNLEYISELSNIIDIDPTVNTRLHISCQQNRLQKQWKK